jgi:hypothetical protein
VLSVGRELAVTPAVAWRVLTDTRTWPVWGPTITAVDVDTPVIDAGSRGRLRTPVGLWLPFEVTELVVEDHWRWRVAGVPATGHRVEARPGGCWVGFEVPALAAPYLAVCRLALGRIARLVEENHPPG